MHRFTAPKMAAIVPSRIRRVLAKANQLAAQGREIIHLEIGRPDFDTPEPIKEAAIAALRAGQVHYCDSRGIAALRQAIAQDASDRLGLAVDPDGQVLVTAGSSNAIGLAMVSLLEQGDEILVPDPMYLFYSDWGALAGAKSVAVPTSAEDGYQLSEAALRSGLSEKTKMILLNSPNNPTGTVYNPASLEAVAKVARERDLVVIADEVYDRLVYPPAEHISIAGLPGMAERTLVVNSFSKPFAMDGWRVGWLIAPPEMTADLENTHHRMAMNVTTFAQFGALEALSRADELAGPMLTEYAARRELCLDIMSQSKTLTLNSPEGAFYLWINTNRPELSEWQAAEAILERAGVALTPGIAFGPSGRDKLRVSFAATRDNLTRGLNGIIEVMDNF